MLWREYGHLEWLISNLDEARKVFSTAMALGGSKGLRNLALCDLCLLWAQLEVEEAARAPGVGLTDVTASPAVCVLTQLAEAAPSPPQTLSPVSILKARKLYDQALTDRLSALDQTRRKGSLTHILALSYLENTDVFTHFLKFISPNLHCLPCIFKSYNDIFKNI